MQEGGLLPHLLQLQAKNKLPEPATLLESCFVGPTSEERQKGGMRWGDEKLIKRRRNNNVDTSQPTGSSPTNAPTSSTFSNAMQTFLSSGCCIIPDVLPEYFVSKVKEKASFDLASLNSELQNRRMEAIASNQEHLLARVARGDFQELVDRDGGRRDIRFQLDRFPFNSLGLIYNPIVYSLVRELLGGGDVNLLYAGIMWALPQKAQEGGKDTASQKWHADGGHLFDHQHLPPHSINVFYPLIDLNSENGPTEVMPGTHRLGKLNDPSAAKFGLCCDAGSAVLFDYRINHRGRANFSSEARPVLYLCYAKPFFRDAGNTRSCHSLVKASSPSYQPSPPWVARILGGDPVSMGEGFEYDTLGNNIATWNNDVVQSEMRTSQASDIPIGSGERWVLFKMNIEVPNCEIPKVITVYHGDIATEVSAQFCKENDLSDSFVNILAETIDAQITASLQ